MTNNGASVHTNLDYQKIIAEKDAFIHKTILEKDAQIALLKHELAELKRLIYGSKSERFVPTDPRQGILFELAQEQAVQEPVQQISYTRSRKEEKKKPLRLELPAHLPRIDQVIEPEGLPQGARKIGEAITEVLDYEPANVHVLRIIRPKYLIASNDEQTQIVIANLPTMPIPKGNAGPGILAHILISKFVDHLPFYRQVQIFKRQDLAIAESTLGGWFNASCRLLEPLYDTLKKKILSSAYLLGDETPIAVLTKDKPGSTHKGYHWVYQDPINKLVLFDYQPGRGREGPDELLKDFQGYLQTDGYTAYDNLKNKDKIIQLACMAHARRKFEHARDNDPQRAEKALLMFGKLYDVEREAREKNLQTEEIRLLRQERSVPVLKVMESWLREEIIQVLPASAIGKAFAYTLKLWPRLVRYIDDGRLHIDNNMVENSIRPVALGRKNYLFAGSHDAARQAAMLYSLLATCKINNVEPFSWLKQTLQVIPDHPANKLYKLLPGQL
jgi:transposase